MLTGTIQIIKLDPSSPSGYERKYAALFSIGYHSKATDAFKTMLLKMSISSDLESCGEGNHIILISLPWYHHVECSHHYEQMKEVICTYIENAIHNSPEVLISPLSGCLCNKSEQAAAFESTPAFTTLIMSMMTHIVISTKSREVQLRISALTSTNSGALSPS